MKKDSLRRVLVCVFCLVVWSQGEQGWAEDRRPDPSRLVMMTLNGLFLWDGVSPEEGVVNFPWKDSQTEAEEHMQEIAALIIAGNPDIVNLVEVENLQALTTFNTQFLAGRGYRPYLAKGTDTFTGQDVALLTRVDPENEQIERDGRSGSSGNVSKSVSKNYIAKFTMGDTQLALISVHLLARPLDGSRKLKRQAQADAVLSMALELQNAGFQVVVLGDFNDFDPTLGSRDHVDSTPITDVLTRIKRMDAATPDDNLMNVATFVPKPTRFTAFHDADDDNQIDLPHELTSIDHILLAPGLAEKVETVEFQHGHDPRQVTDHFPIVVHLRLTEGNGGPGGVSHVRILQLLPNPSGNENQNEAVTLKNAGNTTVNLQGWVLRDRAQRTWTLDSLGTLAAGEEKEITRSGQPMALNNRGDTVDLVDPDGDVIHSVTYASADEEEIITPTH